MRILTAFLLLLTTLQAQLTRPLSWSLLPTDTVVAGLLGNVINEIKGAGDTVWLGTGYGPTVTFDGGQEFYSFSRAWSNLGRGGVAAITMSGDTVWVATAFDSTLSDGTHLQTGGGISVTYDSGQSWQFLGQPMDSLHYDTTADGQIHAAKYSPLLMYGDTVLAVDVVTPINNVTFDLAYNGRYLWSAAFAGGLRRSADGGQTWERVLLPWDNLGYLDSLKFHQLLPEIKTNPEYYALDPVKHYNHRVFSVIAQGDTICVGTAAGVNISLDGGASWRRYDATNSGLSGDFVVALYLQHLPDGNAILWASTVVVSSTQVTGVSYFDFSTGEWRTTLLNERIYNLHGRGELVCAAGERGLFLSRDGRHFTRYPGPFTDVLSGAEIFSDAVYSIWVDPRQRLWVGTGNGLAIGDTSGVWTVHKAEAPTEPAFYAYPNPFTPRLDNQRGGEGHLVFHLPGFQGEYTLTVFDFAMEQVQQQRGFRPGGVPDFTISWNGRTSAGKLVANGTYFFRLETNEGTYWTKAMVIN